MKKALILFAAFAFAVCAFLPVACFATRIEDTALFEPAQLAWPAVRSDYDRGIESTLARGATDEAHAQMMVSYADDMAAALDASDREALRDVPWSVMRPWVTTGIAAKVTAGEIGPGVGLSLREQLANFTLTITRLQEQ